MPAGKSLSAPAGGRALGVYKFPVPFVLHAHCGSLWPLQAVLKALAGRKTNYAAFYCAAQMHELIFSYLGTCQP